MFAVVLAMTINPNIILEIFETTSPNKTVNAKTCFCKFLRFLLKFVCSKVERKEPFQGKNKLQIRENWNKASETERVKFKQTSISTAAN